MAACVDMLKLKEVREGQRPKMTQEQLAYRANVSLRTVARAEAGQSLNARTLAKLAAALGVPVGALFDGEDVA